MQLHRRPQSDILDALTKSGTTETDVINEISAVTRCDLKDLLSLTPDNKQPLSDFETLIEARELLDPSLGVEQKTYKEMLNDLVHMNDALAYCLDPYKFHIWPSTLDSLLVN